MKNMDGCSKMNDQKELVARAPAGVGLNAMPVFSEYRIPLSWGDYQKPKISKYTKLLPKDILEKAEIELENALYRASHDEAAGYAEKLLGAQAYLKHHNPGILAASIAAAFRQFPPDIGKACVTFLTFEHSFIPDAADVTAVCKEMIREREQGLLTAKEQLEEYKRRQNPPKKSDMLRGEAYRDWLAGEYKRNGIVSDGPQCLAKMVRILVERNEKND